MSTIEDFENAPVGATATHDGGSRALKVYESEWIWVTQNRVYLDNEKIAKLGYTLEPSTPTTAREALDLAWDLAHEVKEGQHIPEGSQYLELSSSGVKEYTVWRGVDILPEIATVIRTLEPLPEPEPDWLDAPAVLARVEGWVSCADPQVFTRYDYEAAPSEWLYNGSEKPFRWQDLRDVTPLWPK